MMDIIRSAVQQESGDLLPAVALGPWLLEWATSRTVQSVALLSQMVHLLTAARRSANWLGLDSNFTAVRVASLLWRHGALLGASYEDPLGAGHMGLPWAPVAWGSLECLK